MSQTIQVEATVRKPRERAERAMSPDVNEDSAAVVVGGEPDEVDAALQQAMATIQARDAALAEAHQGRTAAERAAQRMQAQVAQTRGSALAAEVEAATAAKANAITAKRAARESGDLDAELAADEALAAASFKLEKANDALKNAPPQSQAGQMQEPTPQVSAAVQQFIAAHPRWHTDKAFKDRLLTEHNALIADGVAAESPAYFRTLNNLARQLEQPAPTRETTMPPVDRFNGAPTDRGSPGGNSGGSTVQTALGPVSVTRRRDGSIGVQVAPSALADFEEGAKTSKMKLGDYIYEQVKMVTDGTPDMTNMDGKVYR